MNSTRIATMLFGAALLFTGSATLTRAAEGTVAGQWVHKEDGLRVEMAFAEDGRCSASATGAGKAASLNGTYKLGPGEMVVTPQGGKPITYALHISGDRMVLSDGDFDDGQQFELSKREQPAAQAAPAAAQAIPAGGPAKAAARPAPTVVSRPLARPAEAKEGEKAGDEAKLPGGTWDTKALDTKWTIVRRKFDPVKNVVTWILAAKEDVGNEVIRVTYYDEDDVRVEGGAFSGAITFDPSFNVKKGEHVRATLALPKDEIMQKVKRVVFKR